MGRRKGISIRQRTVSVRLRKLRKEQGLSCADVAHALDCSETKISRMETGERGLYADDVAAVLGFLRAPSDTRQELLDLVRDGQERNNCAVTRGLHSAYCQHCWRASPTRGACIMTAPDFTTAVWRKSSRSSSQANCVEVAWAWNKSSYSSGEANCVEVGVASGTVAVRDTKDRDGGMLAVSPRAWAGFLAAQQAEA